MWYVLLTISNSEVPVKPGLFVFYEFDEKRKNDR